MKFETIISIRADERRKKRARRWPVEPSDRSKLLMRRRASTIYLNYWDMGQLANGDDIDFSYQMTIDEVRKEVPDIAPEVVFNYNDFSTDFLDYYESIGRDNWDTTFKKIEDATVFESANFTGDSAYDPAHGFVPTRAEIDTDALTAQSLRAFYSYNTVDYKVTTEPDFSADAVEFHLDKSCDVFLMPEMQLWQGGNIYKAVPPVEFEKHTQILGMFLAPQSREFLFSSEWDTYADEFAAYDASGPGNKWLLPTAFSTSHGVWVDLVKSHPACRMYELEYSWLVGLFTYEEGDLSAADPASFLDGNTQGLTADFRQETSSVDQNWQAGPWVGIRPWHRPEGLLLAAIRKNPSNPTWYYVWQETPLDRDLFHTGAGGITAPHSGGTSAGRSRGGVYWKFVF